MCTVTVIARRTGYILGMNRDERVTRPRGLGPRVLRQGARRVVAPCEHGGGTWVGVNDAAVAFALINWYAVTERVTEGAVSRGWVTRAALASRDSAEARGLLERLPLERVNPFRLIGVFPGERRLIEWRWDLRRLVVRPHAWGMQHWVSSGWDEPGARRTRGAVFRGALALKGAGTLEWLRRLHRSHRPAPGPYSTCMHREDACTVSYTEIRVGDHGIRMQYVDGAPCRHPLRPCGPVESLERASRRPARGGSVVN